MDRHSSGALNGEQVLMFRESLAIVHFYGGKHAYDYLFVFGG